MEHRVKGLDLAYHTLFAILTIVGHEEDEVTADDREAVKFLAREGLDGLEKAVASIDHIAVLVGATYRQAKPQ